MEQYKWILFMMLKIYYKDLVVEMLYYECFDLFGMKEECSIK